MSKLGEQIAIKNTISWDSLFSTLSNFSLSFYLEVEWSSHRESRSRSIKEGNVKNEPVKSELTLLM